MIAALAEQMSRAVAAGDLEAARTAHAFIGQMLGPPAEMPPLSGGADARGNTSRPPARTKTAARH